MRAACGCWLAFGVLVLGAEGGTAPSLLRNGDFTAADDAGRRRSGWSVADWGVPDRQGNATATVELEGPAPERRAARLLGESAGGNVVMIQDLKLPGTGRYALRLECRPAPGSVAYASVVGLSGGKPVVYENTAKVSEAGAWTAQALEVAVPPATETVRILLRTNREAAFSGVTLERLPTEGVAIDSRQEPSNARELAAKQADAGYDVALDAARKAAMTAAERAWETTLEENLGSFYLPLYKRAKEKGAVTAWDYVADDPALPRVLLIGDSISRGYTLAVRQALAGTVNLHRAPANCGATTAGLQKLDVWLGDGNWDLIHFNFGIHDQRSTPEDYAGRLEQIVVRLKATGARLIFAASTPMPPDSDKYRPGACAELNAAAAPIMARHGIPVNDLHTPMLPRLGEFQNPRDCHFSEAGYTFLGKLVAEAIQRELENAKP